MTHIYLLRFFTGHSDDVTAIEVHPDGVRVATAQVGGKPSIFVWDSNTFQQLCHFKGGLKNGISSLAFSPSGDKLAAAAIDAHHEIAVFDITTKSKSGGIQILIEKTGSNYISALQWRTENVTNDLSINLPSFD